jgi:hypothetical protein
MKEFSFQKRGKRKIVEIGIFFFINKILENSREGIISCIYRRER